MEQDRLVKRTRESLTRLSRFTTQLMRENMSCGPVTLQQCYALEALARGPKEMKTLAAQVGLHQSTLTRIVEKLEKRRLVVRTHKPDNRRAVEVEITKDGVEVLKYIDNESYKLVSGMLSLLPSKQRAPVVEAIEILAGLLDPENPEFQKLLKGCCASPPENIRGET